MSLEQAIREHLAALRPESIEIHDDSHLHEGHAGAKDGGHYQITLVCPGFAGQSAVARHRMVYEALADLMRGRIHALSIKAYAPDEI